MAKDSDALGAITASMEPDSSLLAMVQQGHEQAMAQLFERHSKLVYSVALRVLRDPAAAEDVLQEIFMQIWRTPTSFIATRGSLGGWLAVVSRNRSVDLLRKKRPTGSFEDVPFASPYDLANDAEQNLMLRPVASPRSSQDLREALPQGRRRPRTDQVPPRALVHPDHRAVSRVRVGDRGRG